MDPVTANERDDLFLLDVREMEEWQAGHVTGSKHIPMSELGARQRELPTDQTILCICRSGRRSAMVTSALREAGFTAENLEGGLLAWQASKLSLTTESGDAGAVS